MQSVPIWRCISLAIHYRLTESLGKLWLESILYLGQRQNVLLEILRFLARVVKLSLNHGSIPVE